MVFRRSTLVESGGFSGDLPFAADVATWLPIAMRGRTAFWPDTTVTYVLHQGMTTYRFPVTKLIDDVIAIEQLVIREVEKADLEPQKKNFLRQLATTYLRKNFGHIMIQAARRGVPKKEILQAWARYATLIPRLGVSGLSIGAVVIPKSLIPVLGWPYRKLVAWSVAKRWRGNA